MAMVATLARALALLIAGAATVHAAEPAADRGLLVLGGRHVKWGEPAYGRGAVITYGFLDRPASFPDARNCAEMAPVADLLAPAGIDRAAFEREVAAAFRLWSAVADLTFAAVDDVGRARIVIGAQAGSHGVAFANLRDRSGDAAGPVDGLDAATICLDPSERWEIGVDGDPTSYNLRYVAAHEIGHAIGLDHSGRDLGLMGFAYLERIKGVAEIRLAPTDVAAAVRLYGPAPGTALARPSATAPGDLPPASCSPDELATGVDIGCGLLPADAR